MFVKLYTGGWVISGNVEANYIRNELKVYDDDIWIVTPPKCGTTWMQVFFLIITRTILYFEPCGTNESSNWFG